MQRLALEPQVTMGLLVMGPSGCGTPPNSREPLLAHLCSLSGSHMWPRRRNKSPERGHGLSLAFSPQSHLFWGLIVRLACGRAWATLVHLRVGLDSVSCGKEVGTVVLSLLESLRLLLEIGPPASLELCAARRWPRLLPFVSGPACLHHTGCWVRIWEVPGHSAAQG